MISENSSIWRERESRKMEFTSIQGKGGANELLQAQVHLWNQCFSFLKSMSLKCAIDLNIPDVLHEHGKPITLAKLMAALSIPPNKAGSLRRLMRWLICSGLFTKQTDGVEESYLLTPSSRLLVKKERACMSPLLLLILDPILLNPSHLFAASLKEGEESPFKTFHNKTAWEVANENPRFNKLFNEGMASDAQLVVEMILSGSSHVFSGVKSLVDVGGGTGTMATAIAEAFPEIKCTVFDLPHVIDTVPKNTIVEFVGGNMFERIPKADAILLKWILHDWSDGECINILKRCKEAIPSKGDGGKVIIVDMVLGVAVENQAAVETQLLFDMEMMLFATGKERDESEWQNIFFAAGFRDYKISPSLGLRSIIELYP